MLEVIQFRGFAPGPRLVVTAGVHGNETCGIQAVRRFIQALQDGRVRVTRGTLTLVPTANPVAFAAGRREGDRNLNRDFRPYPSPLAAEDFIASALAPVLAAHDVLLDLHSFSAPGRAFVFLGPPDNEGTLEPFARAREESAFALAMPAGRIVHGWLTTYASGAVQRPGGHVAYGIGTTEYLRSVGGYGITVECGQHLDPEAPTVALQCIEAALHHFRMIDPGTPSLAPKPAVPATEPREWIRLDKVFDRHHEGDAFVRPWTSFDRIAQGEPVARRHDGEVIKADADGYIVFPNPGAPIDREWFYFGYPDPRPT